jgi:hypothetical protein
MNEKNLAPRPTKKGLLRGCYDVLQAAGAPVNAAYVRKYLAATSVGDVSIKRVIRCLKNGEYRGYFVPTCVTKNVRRPNLKAVNYELAPLAYYQQRNKYVNAMAKASHKRRAGLRTRKVPAPPPYVPPAVVSVSYDTVEKELVEETTPTGELDNDVAGNFQILQFALLAAMGTFLGGIVGGIIGFAIAMAMR